MVTYRPALAEEYEDHLRLMRAESGEYLETSLAQMGMDWQSYADLFRTVGQVYTIVEAGNPAGFFWIEERGSTVHLHGLILKESAQGRGIGTQILNDLREKYCHSFETIELGVHRSNEAAKALYERLGYRTIRVQAELGYFIMQLPLAEAEEPTAKGPKEGSA